jgi:hypothetical protein
MVLAIGAYENQAAAATWRSTYGLTHPVLADPTGAIYSSFAAGFVPHNSIIDGNKILRYTEIGFDEPGVVAMIEHLLLNIDHVPLPDSEDDLNPYPVNCSINSAEDLIPTDLLLHWNLDGGATFNEVVLTAVVADAYTTDFTAEIPAQPYGTTVYYFLSAANTVGRSVTDPTAAPTALHDFFVGVDSTPPVIDHQPLEDQVLVAWPATVSATVTDNQGVGTVTLEFMINGGPPESVPMVPERDGVYSADLYGTVSVGDLIEYRITAVDVAATPNSVVDPTSGYHAFSMVEQTPVFIFEPDGTPLSGGAIGQVLNGLGIVYDAGTTLPSNPSKYRTIFACLGVYSTNHALTSAEGLALAEFLDYGGRLYMEGGDTWSYDAETAVHPYFHIDGLSDGSGDAGPIAGAVGTFTEGMQFQYSGSNNYMDRIAPLTGAEVVFLNVTPQYINGVAYDGGTYRTIGTSFKFGGLVDGTAPSTKRDLVVQILEFFDMENLIVLFGDGFEDGTTDAWGLTVP